MAAPVPHTCPDIDKVIKELKNIQKHAKDGMKLTNKSGDDQYDHYQRYKDIEWDIDDLTTKMEELRKANAALREWGEGLEEELKQALADQPTT